MDTLGIMILMFFSYVYTDFLIMYVACKNLGRKFSLKTTIWITIACIILKYVFKLIPMVLVGNQLAVILSPLVFLINFIYFGVLFQTTIRNKIVYTIFVQVVAIITDMTGVNITTMIIGEFAFLQADHYYTPVVVLVSNICITLGLICFRFLWNWISRIEWKNISYQWLCLLLPLSQWIILSELAMEYLIQSRNLTVLIWSGLFLGLAADVYMFVLFYRSNQRAKMENELRQLNHQYELELLRYEKLKHDQEEVSKMRHDFQNYIVTIKNLN